MSNALNALRKAGITLEVDGGNLVARPRSAITDELRGLIRANKGSLMAELRSDDEIEVIRQAFRIEVPKAMPALVRCCDCASFVADPVGDGLGIGRCATNGGKGRSREGGGR